MFIKAESVWSPARRDRFNDVYVFTEPGVTAPRIVGPRQQPACTDQARLDEVRSAVFIQSVIRRNGDIEFRRITMEPGVADELLGATMSSVRQWDFEPATRNGEPVDVFYDIEVNIDCR